MHPPSRETACNFDVEIAVTKYLTEYDNQSRTAGRSHSEWNSDTQEERHITQTVGWTPTYFFIPGTLSAISRLREGCA